MTDRWQTLRAAVRIGLRPLENGRSAGPFQSASELLASQLDQQQLDVAPTHSP